MWRFTRLTVGQLNIADGVATVTDHRGAAHVVEAKADPVLCRPCELVRWRCDCSYYLVLAQVS
jgi:hypothetical protein